MPEKIARPAHRVHTRHEHRDPPGSQARFRRVPLPGPGECSNAALNRRMNDGTVRALIFVNGYHHALAVRPLSPDAGGPSEGATRAIDTGQSKAQPS